MAYGDSPIKVSHRSGKVSNKTPDPTSGRKNYASKLAEKYHVSSKKDLSIDPGSPGDNIQSRVGHAKTPQKSGARLSKQDRKMIK